MIMYNEFRYEKYFFVLKNFTESFGAGEVNGESNWYLTVTLRDNYLAAYLGLRDSDDRIHVRYALSILNVDHEETNTMVFERNGDVSSYAWGCHTFISTSDLFKNAAQLLPHNTLTFVLRAKFIPTYSCLPYTMIKDEFKDPKFNFLFLGDKNPKKFKRFHLEQQYLEGYYASGQEIRSDVHTIGDTHGTSKWYVSLFPNGFTEQYEDLVSIHLTLESSTMDSVEVQGRISFVNYDKILPVGRIFKHTFKPSESLTFNSFYTYRSLLSAPYNYNRNPLVLECEIEILSNCSNSSSDCALSKDFQKLFDAGRFSDVTIKIEDKTLEAHKLVLIARSNVFASMFEANMIENKENNITITDVDFDIMQEMLRYIYTDKVENINEMAPALLLAADKYNIESLVSKCEEYLLENLTNENIFNILQICDKIQLKHLEAACKEFLKRNLKVLIQRPEWVDFAKAQTNLMTEVLRDVICRSDFYLPAMF